MPGRCFLGYIDVGCHLGCQSVGALGYADDIALLAPYPSAMRIFLRECEAFASQFEITFNAISHKTHSRVRTTPIGSFQFFFILSVFLIL